MAWDTLSLHFKQTYEGGYRYLDKCGEFIVDAMRELDAVPAEVKLTGAKLDIPEKGVNIACDTVSLVVVQELPIGDSNYFVELSDAVQKLAKKHFNPLAIVRTGFAWKSFWPFSDVREMLKASLQKGADFHAKVGQVIDMVPEHKKLEYSFSSGSSDLNVTLEPVTFERRTPPTRNVAFHATPTERSRIDRMNKFTETVSNKPLSHALVLLTDLAERMPPESASLKTQFELLTKKHKIITELFS